MSILVMALAGSKPLVCGEICVELLHPLPHLHLAGQEVSPLGDEGGVVTENFVREQIFNDKFSSIF